MKKNKFGGLTLPDFKTYCKPTVIKTRQSFLTNGIRKTEYPPKNEVGYLLFTIKMNLKWIQDLNVRAKTIELLEENRGGKILHDHIMSMLLAQPTLEFSAP